MTRLPTVQDAQEARHRLVGRVVRTPTLRSDELDHLTSARILAKAESLQTTGSFKYRGALNRLLTLRREDLDRGVITVSSGNAAIAFAGPLSSSAPGSPW